MATYKNWFPMDDHPGVTGAYTWLTNKGHGPVPKAIKERGTFFKRLGLSHSREALLKMGDS